MRFPRVLIFLAFFALLGTASAGDSTAKFQQSKSEHQRQDVLQFPSLSDRIEVLLLVVGMAAGLGILLNWKRRLADKEDAQAEGTRH